MLFSRMIRSTALHSCLVVLLFHLGGMSIADEAAAEQRRERLVADLIGNYCLDCHNGLERTADLDLETIDAAKLNNAAQQRAESTELWERIVRRLRSRQMPPSDATRPDEATYEAVVSTLERKLDQHAAAHPRPGRVDTFRRLTRTEYQNAIRDLLALDIDVSNFLPKDEASHGFDNITVGELSPTLLNRYISAAQKISRLAIGRPQKSPGGDTIRIRPDVTQEERVEGLPFGTRGGAVIPYYFPVDGEYEIQIRLARDRNEHVEGLNEPHELEVLLDLELVQSFTVKPPRGDAGPADGYGKPSHANVDQHLRCRVAVTAGPHELGVTFLKNPSSLLETRRQPLNVHFNMYRHPRIGPAVYQVSIAGPFQSAGSGETASRQRIFVCRPTSADDEESCATTILTKLMRRAYRRPVTDEDLATPLRLFRQASREDGFEAGIEMGLSAILVNPQFLFRVERQPEGLAAGTPYRISDLELASRLAFFLWSSIPDEELLDLAVAGRLGEPEVLAAQVRRMLADPRAASLVTNFADQWLYLRNLEAISPDMRLYPDFDDNLRQAMKRETELFFENMVREDRSVLDLIAADYTFLNERLARHYGIPHVHDTRFRQVELDADSRRGGLLRQASILTVTSYATRTSPVIRGKWILENILGTPPPPPPANVPALTDNTVAASLSVRQRLAQHRANAACAACHNLIDPAGFALENFDAVGRWRDLENEQPVDATGGLPDGSEFTGVDGLETALLRRPELFVSTLSEKLLTYALGRGIEHFDAPAIRAVVRAAEADDYRFSALILAIVQSTPFQMRTAT